MALDIAQKKAAELIATKDVHDMTLAEIAEEVGTSERNLYRWKKEPEFITYQNELSERIMEAFIAEAYSELRSLVRNSQEGLKLKALELVLKNRGKLKQDTDVNVKVEQKSNQEIQAEIEEMLNRTKL